MSETKTNPEIIESHCHEQEKSAAASRLNEFPRPNSKSVLDESSNDEDNQMDFSVEKKILEKAKQKKKNGNLDVPDDREPFQRSKSPLEECEYDDEEIVHALKEIDGKSTGDKQAKSLVGN
ncbi:hypothetical protein M3Y94_01062700 [Aphelenchoides besseyi]|nr:hypothetical protein M3Y94_01062700 [Aphelenchoides besseyi]